MRNSIYPRHTIGNAQHAIFGLAGRQGLVQGITKLHDVEDIKADRLVDFGLVKPGATKTFENAARVEVVEFGGWHGRQGFQSTLKTQIIELEAGAKLTGPAAWREVDGAALPASERAEPSKFGIVGACAVAFLLGAVALTALMSIQAAVMVLAAMAVIALLALIYSAVEQSRIKHIERTGSAYILAPNERVWGYGVPKVI